MDKVLIKIFLNNYQLLLNFYPKIYQVFINNHFSLFSNNYKGFIKLLTNPQALLLQLIYI